MKMRLPNRANLQRRLSLPSRINVGAPERWVSITGGGLAFGAGLWRRGVLGSLLSLLGGYLLLRGFSGRCLLYQKLGITSAKAEDRGLWGRNLIHVRERLHIQQPQHTVYRSWRRLENLPQAMRHIHHIHTDGNRSSWVARLPLGLQARWESQIIQDSPNERLAWSSVPGSQVESRGEVRFRPTADNATAVDVDMYYHPPGGALVRLFAPLFGGISAQLVQRDLERFKAFIEAQEDDLATDNQGLGRAQVTPRHG